MVVSLVRNLGARYAPRQAERGQSFGMDGDLDAVVPTLNWLSVGLSAASLPSAPRVVELGPGRTTEMLAALLLAGARTAIGLDVVVRTGESGVVAPDFNRIAVRLCAVDAEPFRIAVGSTPADLRARAEKLTSVPVSLLKYSGDQIPLPDGSVDLIISKSVLEHVQLAHVPILLAEARRVLSRDGHMVHIIDLRDHLYIDGDHAVQGDWLHALRYPSWLFAAMFSARSTHINRMRSPEWRRVIEEAGFRVLCWEPSRFALPNGFDRRHLAARWRSMPDDVLDIGHLCVCARRLDDGTVDST